MEMPKKNEWLDVGVSVFLGALLVALGLLLGAIISIGINMMQWLIGNVPSLVIMLLFLWGAASVFLHKERH